MILYNLVNLYNSFLHVFAELQKAKSKAQSSNNLKEEASLCNQLGEVYAKTGKT